MSGVAPLRYLQRLPLAAVGINSVVGGGIFILPATVAALVGSWSIPAYLIAALIVLGVGGALARLAARFDVTGGPYLYVQRSFGRFAGFQVGWLFCLARLTALANLLNGFALYLGALLPPLAHPFGRTSVILACAAAVAATNIVGIRQTARATNAVVFAKIAPLVILGLTGLFFVRPENFSLPPLESARLLRAVLLLIFAFSGFEIMTVPAEEALRPRRDVPTALIGAISVVCLLYILVHSVATGMLPGLADERAPLASVAGVIAGPTGRYAMTAVAAVSIAGCSLASLLGATRLLYAMSSAGDIPAWMGALHPKRRTPVQGTLLAGGLATILAIVGGYAFLAAVSAGARLLTYFACCLACAQPSAGRRLPVRIPAALTSVAIVVLLFGLERHEVLFGMIGIGVGMLLYSIARRGRAGSAGHREVV